MTFWDSTSKRPGLEGRLYRGVAELARDNVDTIVAGTPRHWRRCGGYNLDRFVAGASFRYPRDPRFNLAKLISGSEGTLAVMTELKLGVVDLPARTGLAVVHFDSMYEALSSVPTMLETRPSAIELLDNLGLTLCRAVPQYARLLSTFVDGEPDCVLITEFRGETDAELRARVDWAAAAPGPPGRQDAHRGGHRPGACRATSGRYARWGWG